MNQLNTKTKKNIAYRFSQLMGFLLGVRFFVTAILTFALYVSTFFLFNREESFRDFVFDYHVHLIIFCSILSILAGGIINQFYDLKKDKVTKPFRTHLQSFLQQKYYLYLYLSLNVLCLGIALTQSWRVFVFFLVYQFMMWFYSHKLSKIMIVNNLTFVALSLYPFFGMLVYYKTFTLKVLFMAIFLFLMLLIIDMIKDLLTKNADKIFGYYTIANTLSNKWAVGIVSFTIGLCGVVSITIIKYIGLHSIMAYYFLCGLIVLVITVVLLLLNFKNYKYISLNLLRFWVFIGIIAMLLDGIFNKLTWLI